MSSKYLQSIKGTWRIFQNLKKKQILRLYYKERKLGQIERESPVSTLGICEFHHSYFWLKLIGSWSSVNFYLVTLQDVGVITGQ